FLFGIARNRVRRHLEHRGHDVPLPDADDAAPTGGRAGRPEADLERREAVAALRQAGLALAQASPEGRGVVGVRGASQADAARGLGCGVGAVRPRLFRARRILASRLGGTVTPPAGTRRGAEGRYA